MDMSRKIINIIALVIFTVALVLPTTACQSGSGDWGATLIQQYNNLREWWIMWGAKDRIEKVRQGDAYLTIVDDSGTPVRGARIRFEQQDHEFLFGSNLTPLGINGPNAVNQDWANAYTSLFNYGTLPFNWNSYEPAQGEDNEQALRAMADWSRKRGIVTKGHPLVSTDGVPPWVPPGAQELQNVLEKHVKGTTSAFCGLTDYWDVVNEPIAAPRANNPLGSLVNSKTPAVICADALGWARSGCPSGTMIINDYRTDQDYRDLLQNIIRLKGKFDAIGIESHMHRGNWPLYQVWDICERFRDLDAPLHFTEVTVLSGAFNTGLGSQTPSNWSTTQEGEALQADYVEKFYTLLFSHPAVGAITWWDFSDLNAWQDAPAGLLRKDMTRKPAYSKLQKLIKTDWWTHRSVYTADDGTATARGFYGTYKITVDKEGKLVETNYKISRGLDNKLKIQLKGYKQPPPTPLQELVWPYLVAAGIIALIVLILMWIAKLKRRL